MLYCSVCFLRRIRGNFNMDGASSECEIRFSIITCIPFLTEMQKRQRYSRLRKEHLWHFYRFDAFGGGRDRGVFINKAAGMKSQMHLKFLELTKNKGGPFRPPLWRSCEDKLTRH